MMNRIFLVILFHLLCPTSIFANGGVVDENHFKKTGNIRLLQWADISLLKEKLNIKIINDTTYIEVHYLLKNNGKTQSVHYGFPVDMYKSEWREDDYTSLLNFDIWVNDIHRKHTYWKVKDAYESKRHYTEFGKKQSYTSKIDRQWHTLKLDFEEGATQWLTVKYAVQNYRSDYYYGFGFIPTPSERTFVYDLFPSSTWADGIVKDFSLRLDLSDLKKHDCSYEIEGLENIENRNRDGVYTFQASNFNLKKRSYLAIVYQNQRRAIANCLKTKYQPFPILSINSSAQNAEYLMDNDPKTVWKAKEGDWIKIKLPKVFRHFIDSEGKKYSQIVYPIGIALLNGDYSTEANFDSNGKVKKMSISLNGIWLEDDSEPKYNNLPLERSVFLSPNKTPFECVVAPLKDNLMMYIFHNETEEDLSPQKDFVYTVFIKINKSTSKRGLANISELYLFRYQDWYGKNRPF